MGLESELDPQARTINLLIGIDNPMDGDGLPLLIGSYVDVELDGQSVRIPFEYHRLLFVKGRMYWWLMPKTSWHVKMSKLGGLTNRMWFSSMVLITGDRIVTTSMSYPIYGASLELIQNQNSEYNQVKYVSSLYLSGVSSWTIKIPTISQFAVRSHG